VTSVSALRTEVTKVRSQGWALVNQELEEGLRALAAPVRDRTGRVVAAVNVSAHASRTSLEAMRRDLLPPLLKAAARIETDIPGSRRP
jgi:IclR family pca regulon transcriptional regulator